MGSLRKPRLSDSQICVAYQGGEARSVVAMRAGMVDRELCEVLRRNGVALRDDAENKALSVQSREKWKSTMRMRIRLRKRP